MRQSCNFTLNIKKPVEPHRQVKPTEVPSAEEIRRRYERLERLKKLGINTTTLDMDGDGNEEYEEDLDKLKASILIMQDKEVPKELEQRIIEKNKSKKDDNKS